MVPRSILSSVVFATALVLAACHESLPLTPAREPVSSATLSACAANGDEAEHAWQSFRKTYPFHAQTIALSGTFGAGCRAIVIAEPPPTLALADIAKALPAGAPALTPRHHGIGHDGWTTDLTTVIPPMSADDLKAAVGRLSEILFKTSYKAYATSIDEVPPSAADVSLPISPGDISHWLLESPVTLTPVQGGPAVPFSTALAGGADGVYFADRGVVVWAMPRPASLDPRGVAAREFALESDLVLGAVASKSGLAIVARERATPIDSIPPLRFETLATIASGSGEELAQSYERNNVLAGRFDGVHDWAPIFLSPELVDTEFGSLLDIADEKLKADSNVGETSYENFSDPQPLWWPFPRALIKYLKASSLTYNWNTNGVGAVVDSGDESIYWVRDTGALPVTYLPEDVEGPEATKAAVTAHRFFSAQEDPVLVRVVQYTALYQIFRAFDVHASAPATVTAGEAGQVLERATFDALQRLTAANQEDVKNAVVRQVERVGAENMEEAKALALGLLTDVLGLYAQIQGLEPANRDEVLHGIAHVLANPDRDIAKIVERIQAGGALSEEDAKKLVFTFAAKDLAAYQTAILAFVPDLDSVRTAYSAAALGQRDPIIRTPSIVVSSNSGSLAGGTGGHNIDAAVPRIAFRGGAGNVVTAAGETLHVERLSLRTVRLTETGEVVAAEPVAPRAASTALHVATGDAKTARGFSLESDASGVIGDARGRVSGSRLVVTRGERGFEVTDAEGVAQHAENRVELVGKLRSRVVEGEPVELHFEGFTADEARGLTRSAELGGQRDLLGIASKNGELPRATIKIEALASETPTVEMASDGRAVVSYRVTLETPKATFFGRLKMIFSRGAVKRMGGRLQEVARIAMSRLASRFGDHVPTVKQAALELRRDLRHIDADVGIHFDQLERQDMSADFIVGTNDMAPAAPGAL